MLSFFRKYEKTFFLFVFAPAVLTLGVSSAMLGFLTNLSASFPDVKVFGKSVDYAEVVKGSEDGSLTAHAWEVTAEKYGVRVTSDDLRQGFVDAVKGDSQFLQDRARKQLEKQGLKPGTQQYQQKFFGAYFQQFTSLKYSPELRTEYFDYRKVEPDDEERFINNIRSTRERTRLVKAVQNLAAATPEQIVASYQEENHLRAFERIRVETKDHVPTVKNVTDKEIESYWLKHKLEFMVPTRFNVHVLSYPFAKAAKKVAKPSKAQLEAFYKENPGYYRDAEGQLKAYADVAEAVAKDLQTVSVESLVLAELKGASEKLKRKNQIGTLAVINSSTDLLDYKISEQVSLKELLAKNPSLDDEVVKYWFNTNIPYRASSPLLGDKAGYIIWLQNRKSSRLPKLEDIRDQVVKAYVEVSDEEAEKAFKQNPAEYRKSREYKIETLMMSYDRVLKSIKKPTKAELIVYHEKNAAKFGKKPFDAVKADVEKDWSESKANKLIADTKDALSAEISKYRKPNSSKKLTSLDVFKIGADVIPNRRLLKLNDIVVAQDKISENELLKGAYSQITSQKNVKVPSAVESIPGKDKGFMVYMVTSRTVPKIPEFKEVAATVKEKILKARSLERAKNFATELLIKLDGLAGDRLQAFMKANNLKTSSSEYFAKDAKTLEGYDSPSAYVSACFKMEPGASFSERIDLPEEEAIDLLRCIGRKDASLDKFAEVREDVRRSAINKVKSKNVAKWREQLMADAKSVSPAHLDYATDLYTGGSDIKNIKYRQLVLRPDRKIMNTWIEAEALKKIKELQERLKKGERFENTASVFSEDSDSRGNGGIMGFVTRQDLTQDYGREFSDMVFKLHLGNVSTVKKLPVGEVSEAIKSNKGMHLIKIVKGDNLRVRLAHIMISTDPEVRIPPENVMKEAKAATRKVIDKLVKRLATESLKSVANDFKDDENMPAEDKGNDLEISFHSPFHRAMLNISEGVIDLPIQVGDTYHVTIASRVGDAEANPKTLDLNLYHAAFTGNKALVEAENFRNRLFDFRENYTSQGDRSEAPWAEIVKEFQKLVGTYSKVPSKDKGGVLGKYVYNKRAVKFGQKWVNEVMALTDKPVGNRLSGVIETDYGFHIVEVYQVEKYEVLDVYPHTDFRLSVIDSADWK